MKKFIVTTTINKPTRATMNFSAMPGWTLVRSRAHVRQGIPGSRRIVRALKAQDEAALRKALLSAGNIRPLRKLVNRAKNEIVKLQEKRRKECKEQGTEFVVMYVEEDKTVNTSKLITVSINYCLERFLFFV